MEDKNDMRSTNAKQDLRARQDRIYGRAVSSGAFSVLNDGSKNLDLRKLLKIEEAVQRLTEISETISTQK